MKRKLIPLFLIIICFSSCGVLIFRKVSCRTYKLQTETYWFQGEIMGDTYIFKNKQTGKSKTFYVYDKWISHRANYKSDTGCDCHNQSVQGIVSGLDSLWYDSDNRYIYNHPDNINERIAFKFTNDNLVLNKKFSNISFKSISINGISLKQKTITKETEKGKASITFTEKVGVTKFSLPNSGTWEVDSIKVKELAPISSYRYMTNYCY